MKRFFKNWFQPTDFGRYELFLMRVLFALVVWDILPQVVTLKHAPHPAGLAHWVDFGFFAGAGFYKICRIVMAGALVFYALGRMMWVALPVMLFVILGPGTLEASQNSPKHSTQVVALIVMVQCVWYLVARIRRGKEGRKGREEARERHALGAFYAQQTIAASYVVSAMSKIMADGNWLSGAMKNYPLQMIKTARQNHYNTLEPPKVAARDGVLGTLAEWVQPVFLPMEQALMHSAAWRGLLLGSGFLLELLAVIALVGRKSAAFFGCSLVFFHFAIFMVMGLKFQYHMAVLIIFFINVPFWLGKLGGSKLKS